MIDNLSIAVHSSSRHMLTSLSVDKILLPRYVNISTNFRGLPFKVEMYSVLFTFTQWPIPNLLLALGYSVGIQLELMYLHEALDHLCSLRLLQFL